MKKPNKIFERQILPILDTNHALKCIYKLITVKILPLWSTDFYRSMENPEKFPSQGQKTFCPRDGKLTFHHSDGKLFSLDLYFDSG